MSIQDYGRIENDAETRLLEVATKASRESRLYGKLTSPRRDHEASQPRGLIDFQFSSTKLKSLFY
jgi:hypothetical protein